MSHGARIRDSEHQPPSRATSEYTALARQVNELGLMRRRYGYYWTKMILTAAVLIGWLVGFVHLGDSWWQLLNAAVLGVVMAQVAFLGHDAAHRQIFKSGAWNDWASLIIANLIVGISHGWWRGKHNRHHGNPNKEGSDPDIALAALAFTPARAHRRQGRVWRWLIAHQGWYCFPLLLLEGVSLHVSSLRKLLTQRGVPRRVIEIALLVLRLGGLIALAVQVLSPGKAAAFLGIELGVFGFYLGASFAPNHIGMPLVSAQLKLDFLQRQVLVSRNVTGGRLMAVLLGGLNYQIEHHLFPSMARSQLRRAQPLVAAYCEAQQVPYTAVTLSAAFRAVVTHLNTVGLRDRDPFLCPLVAQRRSL